MVSETLWQSADAESLDTCGLACEWIAGHGQLSDPGWPREVGGRGERAGGGRALLGGASPPVPWAGVRGRACLGNCP